MWFLGNGLVRFGEKKPLAAVAGQATFDTAINDGVAGIGHCRDSDFADSLLSCRSPDDGSISLDNGINLRSVVGYFSVELATLLAAAFVILDSQSVVVIKVSDASVNVPAKTQC